jgi:hypothetical protein
VDGPSTSGSWPDWRFDVLRDSDVRKSASLMLKTAIASCWFAENGPAEGEAAAAKIF